MLPGLTTYYARHTWASIAFNLGIQKDVVSLALGHSFGVRVTDTYINADLSRVDEANSRVIDYVLYNKKIALFLANLAQKRLKLFSWIVLRAYYVSGSERKFRGKSKERAKNIDITQVVGMLV